jgi:hypothetical protein
MAISLHQDFKWAFIAAVPRKGGVLPFPAVASWIIQNIKEKNEKKERLMIGYEDRRAKIKKVCAGICWWTYTTAFFLVFIAAVLEKEGVSLKVSNLSLITEKFKNKKGGFMRCGLNQVKYPICGEPLVMRNGYYFCRTCFKNFEKSTHLKAATWKNGGPSACKYL